MVEVIFDGAFGSDETVTAAGSKDVYLLMDLGAGANRQSTQIPIASVEIPPVPGGQPATKGNTVYLILTNPLTDEKGRYAVSVSSSLTFGKDKVPADPTPEMLGAGTKGRLVRQWAEADDRDDADVYFAGSISNSENQTYYGSTDIKVRVPKIVKQAGSYVFWVAPNLDFQTSNNPDADPDSIKLGASVLFNPHPLLQWETVPGFESTKDFDANNFVVRSELTFLPYPLIGKKGKFWVNPVAGIAFGGGIDAPNDLPTGSIFRTLLGFRSTLKVPVPVGKLGIGFGYMWWHLYKDELVGETTVGKGNRHWLTFKAELGFNDYMSVGVTIQDGSQPPSYKDVNRNVAIDLIFKAKRILGR